MDTHKASYNHLINIQARQLSVALIGFTQEFQTEIKAQVKRKTFPCPETIKPDEEVNIALIEAYIPRGEYLYAIIRNIQFQYHSNGYRFLPTDKYKKPVDGISRL